MENDYYDNYKNGKNHYMLWLELYLGLVIIEIPGYACARARHLDLIVLRHGFREVLMV
jgi:hypothetical protein